MQVFFSTYDTDYSHILDSLQLGVLEIQFPLDSKIPQNLRGKHETVPFQSIKMVSHFWVNFISVYRISYGPG